ncbi:hypothetical protein FW755_06775 [Lonepinella koalarum]|uniref:type II toxin-antitoxin system YafO family toxin n=1 Tax=Lonepinella koalarum TaxID=53417 RepID=UPI0011E47580|nr:type II toxin-antitoxin system YafO family toxin [Lonepinella koalarum]TYG34810.1 hypothetical protein FW755_06775 [Lonepinella koalarum]
MVFVSIENELVDIVHIDRIAKAVAIFEASKQQIYADFLGHYSGLDSNPQAKECGLNKLHIALTEEELISRQWHFNSHRPQNRTSDSFIIFVRHWLYPEYVRILDIVSPQAHQRIDKLIPDLINKAELFFSFNKAILEKQHHYIPDDIITGQHVV